MMRKTNFLLSITAFLVTIEVYSQSSFSEQYFDPVVIKNGYYNGGIYENLNQFLTNSPEQRYPIRIDYRDNFLVYFGSKENVLMYFDSEVNKFKRYNRPNWGVCISNRVYLKHSGKYIMIQPIGRFSFFTVDRYRRNFSHTSTAYNIYDKSLHQVHTFSKPKLRSVDKEFIIDFKTNKRYRLTIANVKILLMAEDMDLYNDFIKTENKKYFIKEYILKLNKKY